MTERAVWTDETVREAGWYWIKSGASSYACRRYEDGDDLPPYLERTEAPIPSPARLAALEELERAVRVLMEAIDVPGYPTHSGMALIGKERTRTALRALDASAAGESGEGG